MRELLNCDSMGIKFLKKFFPLTNTLTNYLSFCWINIKCDWHYDRKTPESWQNPSFFSCLLIFQSGYTCIKTIDCHLRAKCEAKAEMETSKLFAWLPKYILPKCFLVCVWDMTKLSLQQLLPVGTFQQRRQSKLKAYIMMYDFRIKGPLGFRYLKNSPIKGWGGLSKMSNKMCKMSIIELSQLGQDLFDFSGLTWAHPLTQPSTHR